MSSGAQTITGVAGGTLLVLNFWTGDSRKRITAGLAHSSGPNNTSDTLPQARSELAKLGASTLFVGAAVMLAGLSRQWGLAMATAIVGLLILWAINHYTEAAGAQSGAGAGAGLGRFRAPAAGGGGATVRAV